MDVVDAIRRLLGDRQELAPDRSLLTRLPPGQVPPPAWPLIDALWATEAGERAVTSCADLPRLAADGWLARVSLWRGDITTLEAGAIVNAANSGLTGCYQPFHACVDNAIHTAAGPRLREECGRLMAGRGRPEATSTATVTDGYFLPARRVLHTVGPTVRGRAPTPADEAALRGCYAACLEAAEQGEMRSVALCGIATGVFGYPVVRAAPVALVTVRASLQRSSALEHVVLVVYTDADQAAYAAALEEECHV